MTVNEYISLLRENPNQCGFNYTEEIMETFSMVQDLEQLITNRQLTSPSNTLDNILELIQMGGGDDNNDLMEQELAWLFGEFWYRGYTSAMDDFQWLR